MLSINISETIWAIICFLVLYFVLKKLLFDPLVSFMDDRKKRIASSASESESIKTETEELKGASDAIIKAAEAEASGIIADGEAADAKALAAAVEEAKSELAAIKAEKQNEISASVKTNSKDISSRKEELASAVAEKILDQI